MSTNSNYLSLVLVAILSAASLLCHGQQTSALPVKFMITYDESAKTYTAWVVPSYDLPNANNPTTEEKGATAQFTIRVPKGFIISSIRDIKGAWDKQPALIGGTEAYKRMGADPDYQYYVIGKAPTETNYGAFKKDEPVGLFSFSGSGGDPKKITVLEGTDPFIQLADQHFSLNVRNSFYSRSGQYRSIVTTPTDQFDRATKIQEILNGLYEKFKAYTPTLSSNQDMQLILYPNPVRNQLTIKYFSLRQEGDVSVELVNLEGKTLENFNMKADYGINTLDINLESLNEGVYLVRTEVNGEVVSKKIVKGN